MIFNNIPPWRRYRFVCMVTTDVICDVDFRCWGGTEERGMERSCQERTGRLVQASQRSGVQNQGDQQVNTTNSRGGGVYCNWENVHTTFWGKRALRCFSDKVTSLAGFYGFYLSDVQNVTVAFIVNAICTLICTHTMLLSVWQ